MPQLEHFYQTIEGFMNDRNRIMLDLVMDEFPSGGTWVELGSWMGRSAAYSVVELVNREKIGKFYCIDTWQGGDTLESHHHVTSGNAYRQFLKNIEPVGSYIAPLAQDSSSAAAHFDDKSVDFCYVDALHTYEGVTADLTAWWPKIKPGSRFGGDDYTKGWPGVVQAVHDFFAPQGVRVSRCGRCWIVTKPQE